jgi:hypothetical protein
MHVWNNSFLENDNFSFMYFFILFYFILFLMAYKYNKNHFLKLCCYFLGIHECEKFIFWIILCYLNWICNRVSFILWVSIISLNYVSFLFMYQCLWKKIIFRNQQLFTYTFFFIGFTIMLLSFFMYRLMQ